MPIVNRIVESAESRPVPRPESSRPDTATTAPRVTNASTRSAAKSGTAIVISAVLLMSLTAAPTRESFVSLSEAVSVNCWVSRLAALTRMSSVVPPAARSTAEKSAATDPSVSAKAIVLMP